MPSFVVDVEFVYDHTSLKAGRLADGCHRVLVLADDMGEAELIAAQIVACTQCPDAGMPTRTMPCI